MRLRRLYPQPGEIDIAEAAAGLADREVLALNMVASVDGRAAVAGRTKALGDDADRALFHELRTQADAILVGAGTLRAERYGRLIKTAEQRDRRRRAGREDEPLAVTLTRSMDLPYDIPLFQDPDARIAIFTTSDREPAPCPAAVLVVRLDEVTPGTVLESLRATHGVRSILCEGGPTLNGELFAADAVDELFFTLSPTIAGGPAPLTMLEGSLPELARLRLLAALEHAGTLLLRYAVERAG